MTTEPKTAELAQSPKAAAADLKAQFEAAAQQDAKDAMAEIEAVLERFGCQIVAMPRFVPVPDGSQFTVGCDIAIVKKM